MPTRIMVAVHNSSPIHASTALATRWAQRLGGSVTSRVLDDSPLPVFLFH